MYSGPGLAVSMLTLDVKSFISSHSDIFSSLLHIPLAAALRSHNIKPLMRLPVFFTAAGRHF